jgi:galactokinase
MMRVAEVRERFQRRYQAEAAGFAWAPGRVNLIGEHTDYAEGFVLPAAIELGTLIAFAPRSDHRLLAYSETVEEETSLDLDLPPTSTRHWGDYPRAVAHLLARAGAAIPGASLLLASDLPLGAGLSSSASLEVATALALCSLAEHDMAPMDVALVCWRAESEVVGVRCGIMDQLIVSLGMEDHAMLLDCRTLGPRFVALPPELRLVLINSMVRHELAAGEYNLRRAECEEATRRITAGRSGRATLRDVNLADVERFRELLGETLFRRARHVVTENERVLAAVEALERRAFHELGELMHRSHASLRDDYAVSCAELDTLVEIAESEEGVHGARMTGGGFGGCTVNLVHQDALEQFRRRITERYRAQTGLAAEVHVTRAAAGAVCWRSECSTPAAL